MKIENFIMVPPTVGTYGQILLDFGKYQLSVINDECRASGDRNFFEIAILENPGGFVRLPGITEDDVRPYMTSIEVNSVIKKLYYITKQAPVQINLHQNTEFG